jgi:predicted SnoaL-like aldol condensation-catalyzing enzyme
MGKDEDMEGDKNNGKQPKPDNKAMVSIKYGDVVVTVQGEDSAKAKTDAIELFTLLEEKYSAHWDSKVCKERTKYD